MHAPDPEKNFVTPPPDALKVPDVIPIFPLPRVVLLQGEVLPLHIFEPRYVEMVRDALDSHRVIGIVEVLPGHEGDLPESPPVQKTGCVGYIASHEEMPDGRFLMWLIGLERFRIDRELDSDALYRQARVLYEPITESQDQLAGINALRKELRELLPGLVDLDDAARTQFENHMDEISDSQLIALAAQILEISSDRKQALLEAETLTDRFFMIYEDLYRHLDVNPDTEVAPSELN